MWKHARWGHHKQLLGDNSKYPYRIWFHQGQVVKMDHLHLCKAMQIEDDNFQQMDLQTMDRSLCLNFHK